MSEPIITASKVTVYRVNGKGRGWRSKPAAYRHAAIAILNEACACAPGDEDQPFGDTCRYCSRACDGRTKHDWGHLACSPYDQIDASDFDCLDPRHSYRYRLVARLARWLKWRDERATKGKNR